MSGGSFFDDSDDDPDDPRGCLSKFWNDEPDQEQLNALAVDDYYFSLITPWYDRILCIRRMLFYLDERGLHPWYLFPNN